MVNKKEQLTNYQKKAIEEITERKIGVIKIKNENIPKIINLVKSKMFKYSSGFIYLFSFICILSGFYIISIILILLSIVLFVLSIVYDIKFIANNLR